MYSENYYVKDNIVYETNVQKSYGERKTNNHKLLDIGFDFNILLDSNRHVLLVKSFLGFPFKNFIAKSYFCADGIGQYSNNTIDVAWSIDNHHMFDKYVRRIVKYVMLCYKCSVIQRFTPKGVLFMILQYVAI